MSGVKVVRSVNRRVRSSADRVVALASTWMTLTVQKVLRAASVPVGVAVGIWAALVRYGVPCQPVQGGVDDCPYEVGLHIFAPWQCVLFGAGAAAVVLLVSVIARRSEKGPLSAG